MKKFLIIVSALFLASCESESVKMEKEIKALEAADTSTSPEYLQQLQDKYISFYEKYPDNKKSAEFLLRAAEKADYLGNMHGSMALLDTLLLRYPNSEPARMGLMKKALTYENARECEKAKVAYEDFLRRYPKDPRAKDVELSLKNLCQGEEIFENKIVEDPNEEPPVQ